jgi:cold shock CspA family protein
MDNRERTATVLRYDREKGFGFAIPDDAQENDVFIHRNYLPNERRFLNRGDRIVYTLGEYNGRTLAMNIRLAPPQAPGDVVTRG